MLTKYALVAVIVEQSPHIRLSGQDGKAPALHFRPRSVMAAANRTRCCQLIVLAQRYDYFFFYLPVHSKLLIL